MVAAARRLGMTPPLTAKRVFAAARKGDAQGQRGRAHEAERIALAIAAIAPVVDPELVILGGGIGGNGDLLLEPVEQELRELSPFRPRIEVSALGEEATLHGCGVDGAAGGAGPAVRAREGVGMKPRCDTVAT